MRNDELLALDRAHVWHPYGPMPGRTDPLVVASASGVRLRLAEPAEGRDELIDGMSSWWSAADPRLQPPRAASGPTRGPGSGAERGRLGG
ncbi:Adenosylmethionine-8-amino-7-oxononanoate aminotransferase [Streptomyces narbonensis]